MGLLASTASASTLVCSQDLALLTSYYQRGTLGREKISLVDTLPKLFPRLRGKSGVDDPNSFIDSKPWFEALHSDILEYLVADPSQRSFDAFQTKYGFSSEQMQDVVTYFACRHYFNDLSLIGDPRAQLERISELSRAYRLTDPKSRIARLYPYYLARITQLSVPQIAAELSARSSTPIAEQAVYKDLQDLGISIEREFELFSKSAEHLPPERRPSPGQEAWAFYQHYLNERNRGVPWQANEERFLRSQWGHLSSKAIADALNSNRLLNANDPDFRSQAAVTAKARVLGLTEPATRDLSDLDIHGYGRVKSAGTLQDAAQDFLYDNYQTPLSELAQRLGVTEKQLRNFMKKRDIVLFPAREVPTHLARPLTQQQLKNFRDRNSGLLQQAAKNVHGGFATKTPEALVALAQKQIPDLAKREDVIAKIRGLRMSSSAGSLAPSALKSASDVAESLRLIADAKGTPLEDFTTTEGMGIFGWKDLEIKTVVTKTKPTHEPRELSEKDLKDFRDEASGLFAQAAQNIPNGFTTKTPEALIALAQREIADVTRRNEVIAKIQGLSMSVSAGRIAKKRSKTARDVVECLMLIAEAKGEPLQALTSTEGTRVFGWKPVETKAVTAKVKPVRIARELPEPDLKGFRDEVSGLLEQAAQNIPGTFKQKTEEALIALAENQISDVTRKNEVITKIRELGMSPSAGRMAKTGSKSASEIADCLSLIAEAKGTPLQTLTSAEGTRVFGWKAVARKIVLEKAKPTHRARELSAPELEIFRDEASGLLAQAANNIPGGFSYKTPEALIELAQKEIPDPIKKDQVVALIRGLSIRNSAGSYARASNKAAGDIVESLERIAEAKGMPLRALTSDEGSRVFGWKALETGARTKPTHKPLELSKEDLEIFRDEASGIFEQAKRNVSGGFSRNTSKALIALAENQIHDLTKREEVIVKIQGLNMSDRAGEIAKSLDKPARDIAECLTLIAEAKGTPLKAFTTTEGSRVFGWEP
jgi:hypothetical protein